MKSKLLHIILACLWLPIFASAQLTPDNLAGKWVSKTINVPTGEATMQENLTITYEISPDMEVKATYELAFIIKANDRIDIDCYAYVYCTGKCEITGPSELTINSDPELTTFKVDADNLRVRGYPDSKTEEMIKDQYPQLMAPVIANAASYFQETKILSDVKIDKDKMSCIVDDMPAKFNRKKH